MSVTGTERVEKSEPGLREITYTICPVPLGSHVAVEKGWLEEELAAVGAAPRYIRSRPEHDWPTHFTHQLPDFFRDGGNIPAIWARSRGEKTRVVGLTFSGTGGRIIVAAHARFNRISDLRGKKIALPRRADTDRIDFWRATAERGILLALELNGLSGNDVEIVELISHGAGFLPPKPAQKPLDAFDAAQVNVVSGAEVEALFTGEVDAIYADFGRAKILEGEGKVKAIEDLGHYPDWTLQVANTPHTITVSADLAENNPEIVVAYLKAAIRGGRWINENHAEAGRLFANVTSYRCPIGAARVLDGYNFVPNLTGRSIAGIEVEKRFLLDHGYIENDFDVHQWVDRSFLEQALALLDGQVGTGTSPCRAEPACTAL